MLAASFSLLENTRVSKAYTNAVIFSAKTRLKTNL